MSDNEKILVPCEVYQRVSGYYRPVSQWNKGKQEEFKERRFYKLKELDDNNNNG